MKYRWERVYALAPGESVVVRNSSWNNLRQALRRHRAEHPEKKFIVSAFLCGACRVWRLPEDLAVKHRQGVRVFKFLEDL